MIIVPIGIDCGVSLVMKKYNLRKISLPFDWVVSYKGIKEILENDFKEYIPESAIYKEGTDIVVYNKYDVKFIHDKFDEEGYIAIPICLWGMHPPFEKPPLVSGVPLFVKATTNNTYGHHGEMAWLQMLYV